MDQIFYFVLFASLPLHLTQIVQKMAVKSHNDHSCSCNLNSWTRHWTMEGCLPSMDTRCVLSFLMRAPQEDLINCWQLLVEGFVIYLKKSSQTANKKAWAHSRLSFSRFVLFNFDCAISLTNKTCGYSRVRDLWVWHCCCVFVEALNRRHKKYKVSSCSIIMK